MDDLGTNGYLTLNGYHGLDRVDTAEDADGSYFWYPLNETDPTPSIGFGQWSGNTIIIDKVVHVCKTAITSLDELGELKDNQGIEIPLNLVDIVEGEEAGVKVYFEDNTASGTNMIINDKWGEAQTSDLQEADGEVFLWQPFDGEVSKIYMIRWGSDGGTITRAEIVVKDAPAPLSLELEEEELEDLDALEDLDQAEDQVADTNGVILDGTTAAEDMKGRTDITVDNSLEKKDPPIPSKDPGEDLDDGKDPAGDDADIKDPAADDGKDEKDPTDDGKDEEDPSKEDDGADKKDPGTSTGDDEKDPDKDLTDQPKDPDKDPDKAPVDQPKDPDPDKALADQTEDAGKMTGTDTQPEETGKKAAGDTADEQQTEAAQ